MVWRQVSSLINHIPAALHPLLRSLLITLFVASIILGYTAFARFMLTELVGSKRFVDFAEASGSDKALWRMFRSRGPQESRRDFWLMRITLVASDAALGLLLGVYTVLVVTLQHTPTGLTGARVPFIAYVFTACYIVLPAVLLHFGAEMAVTGQALLASQPLGWRGGKWASAQGRRRGWRQLPNAHRPPGEPLWQVRWPAPWIRPDIARAAAARAFRPYLLPLLASTGLGAVTSVLFAGAHHQRGQQWLVLPYAAVLVWLLYLYLTRSVPLEVQVQTAVLWCLQHQEGPVTGTLVDPLGHQRAALAHARQLIVKLARRCERNTRQLGAAPVPLTLRGVAANIGDFLNSPDALRGHISPNLSRTLRMTVVFITGPQDQQALAKLAARVGAYDADGGPNKDLAPAHRALSRVPAMLAATSAVLRNAALAILTPAGFIAFLVHRAAFSGISGYFK